MGHGGGDGRVPKHVLRATHCRRLVVLLAAITKTFVSFDFLAIFLSFSLIPEALETPAGLGRQRLCPFPGRTATVVSLYVVAPSLKYRPLSSRDSPPRKDACMLELSAYSRCVYDRSTHRTATPSQPLP